MGRRDIHGVKLPRLLIHEDLKIIGPIGSIRQHLSRHRDLGLDGLIQGTELRLIDKGSFAKLGCQYVGQSRQFGNFAPQQEVLGGRRSLYLLYIDRGRLGKAIGNVAFGILFVFQELSQFLTRDNVHR